VLGSEEHLQWRQSGDDLIVRFSAPLPDRPAHALRMSIPT
jgi:hypothetical protein